jgi:hypothetical protein
MDLNSSSDEEEDTPVAAPPPSPPEQATIGATTSESMSLDEGNEEVREVWRWRPCGKRRTRRRSWTPARWECRA